MRPDRPRRARAAVIAACEVRLARRRVAVVVSLAMLLFFGWSAIAHSARPAQAQGQAQAQVVRWSERAPLPEPNSEFAVGQLGERIYVVGGYPSTRITVATVHVYDAAKDAWTLGPPVPQPLNHPMAATVDGKLYVIGGQPTAAGRAEAARFLDTVFQFDPATGAWTRRAPMPTARSAGAAVALAGKIYVAGGRPPHGHDFAVYDPAIDRWLTLADLPTERNHLAAAAIDGRLYVVGGRFGAGFRSAMTNALEVYDPATDRWATRAPMPTTRGGINGIAANGCLHVFGGEGPAAGANGVFAAYEVYDPVADRWQRLAPLPVPVHGVTGAAFIDGWVHLPGGGTRSGGSSGSTLHQVFRAELYCR